MVRTWKRQTGCRRFHYRPSGFRVKALGKLITVMCICQPAVQFDIGRTAVMLCGLIDNRRSVWHPNIGHAQQTQWYTSLQVYDHCSTQYGNVTRDLTE